MKDVTKEFRSSVRRTGAQPTFAGRRRRGSAIILVVTVLGILFVTGVAFLSTMSFETRLVKLEQESRSAELNLKAATNLVDEFARGAWITKPGTPTGLKAPNPSIPKPNPYYTLGGPVTPPDWWAYVTNGEAWVDLPGVSGFTSPIEPYEYADPRDPPTAQPRTVYAWHTDLRRMAGQTNWSSVHQYFRYIDTAAPNLSLPDWLYLPINTSSPTDDERENEAPYVADADGDGIVDSFLVDLVGELEVPRGQLADLARVVNTPSFPSDKVYLALRIIPHGGLVNLAEGHPSLIDALMDRVPDAWTASKWSERPTRYLPSVEELTLRNRGGLVPPRFMPPTMIQGNPFDPRDLENPGGHFGSHLFAATDSVRHGDHRYWTYRNPVEGDDASQNDYFLWTDRVNPDGPQYSNYDYRHLVTTISHDDLLARPTQPLSGMGIALGEAVEQMRAANLLACAEGDPIPFEYLNYPHTLPNSPDPSNPQGLDWCACAQDVNGICKFDLRKGRLRLSLPWLDEAVGNQVITSDQRARLVQDVFTLMLLNARGTDWGAVGTGGAGWMPNDSRGIAVTAASLTANFLDFFDADHIPTPVEVRSADFNNLATVGQSLSPREYVFGLEQQPFINELSAIVERDGTGDPPETSINAANSAYFLELFNPYGPGSIRLDRREGVFNVTHSLRIGINGPDIPLPIGIDVPGNGYRVLIGGERFGPGDDLSIFGGDNVVRVPELVFANGDTVYLIMELRDPASNAIRIVVDQFSVVGNIAEAQPGTPTPIVKSAQRPINGAFAHPALRKWFSPIPIPATAASTDPTLGSENNVSDTNLMPVQVLFADQTNTALNPQEAAEMQAEPIRFAFPTTGSMLFLMRHANRSIEDATAGSSRISADKVAFTSHLNAERTEIDNGRMPVFDLGGRHHVNPALDPTDPGAAGQIKENKPGGLMHLPWGQLVFDYFTALPLENPSPWANDGQMSDDDFTAFQQGAKPRVDQMGLRVHGRVDINAAPSNVLKGVPLLPIRWLPDSFKPGVRRALGLVNNSPGVVSDPFNVTDTNPVPPQTLSTEPTGADEVNVWDGMAAPVGEPLARAIVAYREIREVLYVDNNLNNLNPLSSGDFALIRDWSNTNLPTARRGTGYLTVGELANVRHPAATVVQALNPTLAEYSPGRMDAGAVQTGAANSQDFISAVSLLVAMGDWITVRSNVHTVYGSIWGEPQEQVSRETLEDRAIRFQETIDRTPTFLGADTPIRVGERLIARYNDLNSP
jgi:hypothetical protein